MTESAISDGVKRVALITLLLLLIPLAAMQVTTEVDWGPGDFLVAGVLLFGAGNLFLFASRKVRSRPQRLAVGAIVLLGLAVVWAELAVGIFN